VKISVAKKIILEMIRSYEDLNNIPSFMLWGPPGVGKSDTVKQLASELSSDEKEWKVIVWLLSTRNPVDLRGIPVPDKKTGRAVWFTPAELPYEDKDGKYGILFLDEITNAPREVQTPGLQLILDKKLDEYELPKGWTVIAAGNRVTDRAGSYQLASSLCNRFVHLPICCSLPSLELGKDPSLDVDLNDWKQWAYNNNIREEVIAYLNFQPTKIWEATGQVSFATPRTWEFVSRIISIFDTGEIRKKAIEGCIGEGPAASFLAFCRIRDEMPNTDKILEGYDINAPDKADVLYTLCSSLVSKVKKKEKDPKNLNKALDNLLAWIVKMPVEFQVLLGKDLGNAGLITQFSMRPGFTSWADKHKEVFDIAL